jgi:hypothetical protein
MTEKNIANSKWSLNGVTANHNSAENRSETSQKKALDLKKKLKSVKTAKIFILLKINLFTLLLKL